MVKLKAVIELETTEQVALVLDFARTMGLKMEMGSEAERSPRGDAMLKMGAKEAEGNVLPKQKAMFKHAQSLFRLQSSIKRLELTQALAKAMRKPNRFVGTTLTYWLKHGVLVSE